jgi:hypothetical protein
MKMLLQHNPFKSSCLKNTFSSIILKEKPVQLIFVRVSLSGNGNKWTSFRNRT